jgi:hypothetical protein
MSSKRQTVRIRINELYSLKSRSRNPYPIRHGLDQMQIINNEEILPRRGFESEQNFLQKPTAPRAGINPPAKTRSTAWNPGKTPYAGH